MQIFAAYSHADALRAETIRLVAAHLADSGHQVETWEDLFNKGQVMIGPICEAIRRADVLLAEVSTMNLNVLFEVGYAVARGKAIWLAIDESDSDAMQAWNSVRFFQTLGAFFYSGNSNKLLTEIQKQPEQDESRSLLVNLIANAEAREPGTLFAPVPPTTFDAGEHLARMLSRNPNINLLGATQDLGYAPLEYVTKLIYRSSAALVHLVKRSRRSADEHNARASFMAGFATGIEIPTLLVSEPGFISPLDYQDKLFQYPSSAALQKHVGEWLQQLPLQDANPRAPRLNFTVDLPISTLGAYVAEDERRQLSKYYIETSEFRKVIAGETRLFVGRKGTGKTATMLQAAEALRKDKRNLVVSIAPSSYEMGALEEQLARYESQPSLEYFLKNLWQYLILSEVARQCIHFATTLPAGISGSPEIARLSAILRELDLDTEIDLSERLDLIINDALKGSLNPTELATRIRDRSISVLLEHLPPVLQFFQRTAILIDNLDKAWGHRTNHPLMARFLLALFEVSQTIEHKLGKNGHNATLCIFVRGDIYRHVRSAAREADKLDPTVIRWSDKELLLRVLEERYDSQITKQRQKGIWEALFVAEVRGLPAHEFFLWRALPRPRDIIYLAGAALDTAVNRRRQAIQESDALFAEAEYSKFAVDALLVESAGTEFRIEAALFEFAGSSASVSWETALARLETLPDPEGTLLWLVENSFFGIEGRMGLVYYADDPTEADRRVRATRKGNMQAPPLMLRIHPAYRPYFEVLDDDLHQDEGISSEGSPST